ncbi:MAG TPA: hypothetical protein VMQ50_16155 [Casimicrobiaceae bacterium]|nr:hypothetical protein [Casimicrobiaceae bacterium]
MFRHLTVLLVAAAAAASATPASAITCYTLLDASDTVIYRGYEPPVDLSAAGAAERDAMRQRKEYMMVGDVDHCFLVASSRWSTTGTPGASGPASVDEIVADVPSLVTGAPSGTPSSYSGKRGPAPPPVPPARSSSGARSGSTGARGY